MVQYFSSADIQLVAASRVHSKFEDLSVDQRGAYSRIHEGLNQLSRHVLSRLRSSDLFTSNLTSSFNPKSGVRGYLPKDLWFSVYQKTNVATFVGMPQIFMIVSERGVEYGFAAAIHPSDFSDNKVKARLKEVAPAILRQISRAPAEVLTAVREGLRHSSSWRFRRKTRLDAASNDFSSFDDWLEYLDSSEGAKWGAGAAVCYLAPNDIDSADLEGKLAEAASIWGPLLEHVAPGGKEPPRPREPAPVSKQHWMIQANPEYYDIDSALGQLQSLTWHIKDPVAQRQMKVGDDVFVWRSGKSRGVVATATITAPVEVIEHDPEELVFATDPTDERFAGSRPAVRIQIKRRVDPALLWQDIRDRPELKELRVVKFANYHVYPVTDDQAAVLNALIDELPPPGPRPAGQPRTWLYAPGPNARYWAEFLETGIMAIGWEDLGDLSKYESVGDILEEMRTDDNDVKPRMSALACWQFVHDVKPGDVVFAKKGMSSIVGVGEVNGRYSFLISRPTYPNVRPVNWKKSGEWMYSGTLTRKTLTDITENRQLITELESLILDPPTVRREFDLDQALQGLFMSREEFTRILSVWENKKNILLQGPPGVGKSYVAKRFAYRMIGYADSNCVEMTQFHQSYSYEDFIRGYRPTKDGSFVLKDGPFLTFCRKAEDDPTNRYVFIIDEINRGNLSKIFGELMLLVEGDKRGTEWSLRLAYSERDDERFNVPPNVFILGMMNTADRSLSMVDYALRRRFAFVNLNPQFTSPRFTEELTNRGASTALVQKIVQRMEDLNATIRADTTNLGPGFCIGHSFFVPTSGTVLDEGWFRTVVETEIEPLLNEYLFDNQPRAAKLAGDLLA